MSKAILRVGYNNYVLDLRDAVAISEMLAKAEVYESKFHSGKDTTNHIFDNETKEFGSLALISDSFYQMAKLAGPPSKD
jgi:hypothetical protein